MNYAEFREIRAQFLQDEPDLIDLAQTNHVAALGALGAQLPQVDVAPGAPRAHRCHLAEDWLRVFGLPDDLKHRLSISKGVRHSLSLVLPELARQGYHLHFPADVYPVYEAIAADAGIERASFATLPALQLPQPDLDGNSVEKEALVKEGHVKEALLICNPLKPLGRFLTDNEVAYLQGWLQADEQRRLIIDAVYTFDSAFHASTLTLWETGQTILLHSLSKGWVAPLVMGVALVPEKDADIYRAIFRDNSPEQSDLQKARLLLNEHADFPHLVRDILNRKFEATQKQMATRGFNLESPACPGYLSTVNFSWIELKERFGILAIPASVFGSKSQDICVLSTLAATV